MELKPPDLNPVILPLVCVELDDALMLRSTAKNKDVRM